MSTTISLQDQTKKQLDAVLESEGHTSQDSAIKSLLLYRELYLQTQATSPQFSPTQTPTRTNPPKHHATRGHKAYLGRIGSGKTVTAKYHAHHQIEAPDGNNVIIIDPLDEHNKFTKRHDGTVTASKNIIPDSLTTPETVEELRDLLPNDPASQSSPEAKTIPDEDLLTVIFPSITGTEVMDATITAVIEAAKEDDPVDIYIEQSHYLLSPENSHEIIYTLLQYGSRHDVNLNFITQTVEELLIENDQPNLLDRIRTVFMHSLEISEETKEELGLSNGEAAYIRNAHKGTTAPYSEVLIGTNGSWKPKRIELTEDFQKLIDA